MQPHHIGRQFVSRSLLLILSLLLLAGSVVWDNAVNRGIATAGTPPSAAAQLPRGGVNVYNLQYEVTRDADGHIIPNNKVAQTFAMIRAGGFHWVRMQFPWEDLEIGGKGDFRDCKHGCVNTWLKYDYVVQQATANGLELIVRLDRPPDWARAGWIATPEVQAQLKAGHAVTGPPDRSADFADYVAAVAQHYPQVHYFQLWNEPNLQGEWNFHRQDPAELVEFLRIARQRLRAVSPTAQVLFPSLAPTDGLDATGVNDLDYLQGVYAAGGRDTFDILGAQVYGLGQSPDRHRYIGRGKTLLRPVDTRADVGRIVLLREVMERNGDSAKAVWVTELGWNSAPPALPQPWGQTVSEEQKGAYLVAAMMRAGREWPWMGPMCVWMFRWGGEPPQPQDPTPYFQLVDFNFQPLPAYHALQQYLAGPQPLSPATGSPLRLLPPLVVGLLSLVVVGLAGWSLPLAGMGMLLIVGAVAQRWRRLRVPLGWLRGRTGDRLILLLLFASLWWFYLRSAQLPLTALGLLVFVPLALWRPDLALLLVPLTVPLYLAPKGIWDERYGIRPTGVFFPLHEVVLVAACGGVALHAAWSLLGGRWSKGHSAWRAAIRHWLPVVLFVIAGTLGVLVAQPAGRGDAVRAWRWWIIEPVVWYALVKWYGRNPLWRQRLLIAWLGTGGLLALIGLLQVVGLNLAPIVAAQRCFSDAVVAADGVQRASSVYCHPNNLGLALGRIWPVLAALALAGLPVSLRRLWGPERSLILPRTWMLCGLAGVVLLGLLASFSKGAMIGAAGATVVLGLLLRRRALLVAVALAVVLVGGFGLVKGIERLNPLGGSSGARVELWSSALHMLRDHPLTGIGLDQFLRLRDPAQGSPYITPEAAASNERNASHPHNLILDTLLQVGWLGLLALGWLVVRTLKRGWQVRASRADHQALIAGLVAALVAALLHGMVDNFYFVSDLAFSLWLLIALIERMTVEAESQPQQEIAATTQPI